jgi:hypothetical protein
MQEGNSLPAVAKTWIREAFSIQYLKGKREDRG